MKIIDAVLGFFKPAVIEKEREVNVVRLDAVDSTNSFLRTYTPADDEPMTVVVADYQTAGRGLGTNTWESEAGKNLLFSVLVHPTMLPVRSQFLLSEAGALALKEALTDYVKDDIRLKWPNDIYWKDKKLSGTLIETKLAGGRIKDCIFGVGLNVNQEAFHSDAPNPVSLCQILGHEVDKNFTTCWKWADITISVQCITKLCIGVEASTSSVMPTASLMELSLRWKTTGISFYMTRVAGYVNTSSKK